MAYYTCLLLDADNTLLDFDAAERQAERQNDTEKETFAQCFFDGLHTFPPQTFFIIIVAFARFVNGGCGICRHILTKPPCCGILKGKSGAPRTARGGFL